jgi:tryptophan synthase beta chain
VFLKREDLCHTGAHKINNAIGQALVARRLGVSRIVAETGAGQHGVATAAAAARVGLPCTVYMGAVDVVRQRSNVERMKLLGAQVVPVEKGDRTLRSAIDEAMRDWVSDPDGTYYLLGSVVGPHPYPTLVAGLQSVIGIEARAQMLETTGSLPDVVVACVGGGSNAMGMFRGFVDDEEVALLGIEAGGDGHAHSATLGAGTPGVLHGAMTPLLQDGYGQVLETHSIAPGLDYPGVGPEHAMMRDSGRATYESVGDSEALRALRECSVTEGIIPALESAHALAGAERWAGTHSGAVIAVCVSGRGDKDLDIIKEATGE